MQFTHTRSRALAAGLVALVAVTSGCGAIFNGTRQSIGISSAPDAATVTSSPNIGRFTTPTSLDLERKNSYVLTFEKEGYQSATFAINRKMQGGILALDILFTGLLGVVVDAATGAWYKLSPETATVAMSRTSAADGPDTITISLSTDKHGVHIESSVPGVDVRVEQEP